MQMRNHCIKLTALIFGFVAAGAVAVAAPADYFTIEVVDADTGRGVPMVELRTVNNISLYTDSNGIVAFAEPGLMDKEVFFSVKSHGYEYPADGFGYHGTRLHPTAGGKATVKINRVNVAERMYRVTGQGIYRDSVLVDQKTPLEEPRLNGGVLGQDSVHVTPYRGKLFWLWGDTSKAGYPLGNFRTSSATSELPAQGGLDPSQGIDLHYFTDEDGFSRPMVPEDAVPGKGAVWLGGLVTLADDDGRERLVAGYVRVDGMKETYERGLVVFDDDSATFKRLCQFDVDSPLTLQGHPIRVEEDGQSYFYCGYNVPYTVRVKADWKSIQHQEEYEGFTCLAAGTQYDGKRSKTQRDAEGNVVWSWKRNTPPLKPDQENSLVKAGVLEEDETRLRFLDADTGKLVMPHAGSVRWNDHRRRWITIFHQSFGTSLLGEVWFAEAESLTGPWSKAKKIVTHDSYTFYNPVHHPFFDEDGGRRIYFEGTYSTLFSGAPEKTPRYEYNQIMYRLDLDDPRLKLSPPVR